MHLCTLVFIYSYIDFYIHISLYHLRIPITSSSIHILSIFLSCMLLLIHIFIYVPIIHVHVLIPMLCHLLLISIVLIIYAFQPCVPSMFHLIHFGISIICLHHISLYSYVPIIRVLRLSYLMTCSILSYHIL